MRGIRSLVLLGLLFVVAPVISQASAASPATASLRCSWHVYLKSGQISDHGAMVGSVKCGRPFGKGRYAGRYQDVVAPSPFVGSETGSSKLSFKAGTVRGTYTIGQAPISGPAPFDGTLHITGGTGRFKHVAGTLQMTCVHAIPPLSDCTVSGPVTGA
jgi:hypothetical protein